MYSLAVVLLVARSVIGSVIGVFLAEPHPGHVVLCDALWEVFCVQSSKQKLQVLASSCRLTKKSAKDSPGCWQHWRKLCLSTDSFICPSTY